MVFYTWSTDSHQFYPVNSCSDFGLSNSNKFWCARACARVRVRVRVVLVDALKSVILIKVVKLSLKIDGFIVRLLVGFLIHIY